MVDKAEPERDAIPGSAGRAPRGAVVAQVVLRLLCCCLLTCCLVGGRVGRWKGRFFRSVRI